MKLVLTPNDFRDGVVSTGKAGLPPWLNVKGISAFLTQTKECRFIYEVENQDSSDYNIGSAGSAEPYKCGVVKLGLFGEELKLHNANRCPGTSSKRHHGENCDQGRNNVQFCQEFNPPSKEYLNGSWNRDLHIQSVRHLSQNLTNNNLRPQWAL